MLANAGLQARPAACSLNKVLLEHSPTHSFMNYVWSLFATMTELGICNRDCVWLTKPEIFTI